MLITETFSKVLLKFYMLFCVLYVLGRLDGLD